MYGSWHEVPELIRIITVAVVIIVVLTWLRHSPIDSETKANETFAAPDDQQIRWHIRHLREDLSLVVKLLFLIVFMLFFFLVRPI
jgi:hypothetical protein